MDRLHVTRLIWQVSPMAQSHCMPNIRLRSTLSPFDPLGSHTLRGLNLNPTVAGIQWPADFSGIL